MKEAVERILAEEQGAKARLEEARARAGTMVAEAKKRAARAIEDVEREAVETVRRKKADAEKEATAEKARVLEEARARAVAARTAREKDIPAIAREVFEDLMGIAAAGDAARAKGAR